MKSLIIPITIIVGLIVCFIIVDRREFCRNNDVLTIQGESPAANRKPSVSVPDTGTNPQMKPAGETKDMEGLMPLSKKITLNNKTQTDRQTDRQTGLHK